MDDRKRFVGKLAGILFDGVNAFVNHRKQSALQKGIRKPTWYTEGYWR